MLLRAMAGKLGGKDHQIRPGTSIFVPAKADHRFHGNKQDLVIFYALGAQAKSMVSMFPCGGIG
jgi:mannose-6-phosphate isomerase-like protein (cupin superfamily)